MKRYKADDIDNTKNAEMKYCEWCEEDVALVKTKTRRFFGRTIYKCGECLAILKV